jgi:hypothetical protein
VRFFPFYLPHVRGIYNEHTITYVVTSPKKSYLKRIHFYDLKARNSCSFLFYVISPDVFTVSFSP